MSKTFHVVLGSKGGIGKTWVSMWLTVALREAGKSVVAFDLDEQTSSLASFLDLGARPFKVTVDGEVDSRLLDEAFEKALDGDAEHIVVDVGSSVYGPLLDKYRQEGLLALLDENGVSHRAHVVVGGGKVNESLGVKSLSDVAQVMGHPDHPVTVWLNPFTDRMGFEVQDFPDIDEVAAVAESGRLGEVFCLPSLKQNTFAKDLQLARNAGYTLPTQLRDVSKRPTALRGALRVARLRNITQHYLAVMNQALGIVGGAK